MNIAISLIIGMILGGAATWFLLKKGATNSPESEQQKLRDEFKAISAEVFQHNSEQFLQLAETKLSASLKVGEKDLEGKKGLIDQTFGQMKDGLTKVELLMKDLEKDREQKFGQLDNRLENAARVTKDLMDTTNNLKQALSGTKSRGQWGERMAEDVLRLSGFVEGINYTKQQKLNSADSLPDFTFNLPQNLTVNMDVKFPFNNYEMYINADNDGDRERYKTQFLKDVRSRIKELKDRSYINSEERTVDYVLLFIPNEQVYCFIQEMDREIIDEALKAKTILCSPMTLYAVLAVIRQSIDNFAMEQKSQDMLSLFGTFKEQWDKFKIAMKTVSDRLESTQKAFQSLEGTRQRTLDRPLHSIEELRLERGIPVASLSLEGAINIEPDEEEIIEAATI